MEKRSRRGKPFYGCDNFPKCDFATWDKPLPEPCPDCGHPFLVEKNPPGPRQAGRSSPAPNKECGYKREDGLAPPAQATKDQSYVHDIGARGPGYDQIPQALEIIIRVVAHEELTGVKPPWPAALGLPSGRRPGRPAASVGPSVPSVPTDSINTFFHARDVQGGGQGEFLVPAAPYQGFFPKVTVVSPPLIRQQGAGSGVARGT